jgi:hypothetical protein
MNPDSELNRLIEKCIPTNDEVPQIKLTLRACRNKRRFRLDMDMLLIQPDLKFSDLIQPHIGEITSLKISQYKKIENLAEIFPDLPNGMKNLRKLEILPYRYLELERPTNPQTGNLLPDALEPLSLSLGPCSKITTLTAFIFRNPYFTGPLDALLAFLQGNPSLKHVELEIGSDLEPCSQGEVAVFEPYSKETVIVDFKNLQFLSVWCKYRKDLKHLISHITLLPATTVIAETHTQSGSLNHIFSSIEYLKFTPTHMRMDRAGETRSIELSGPNGSGSFYYSGLSQREMIESILAKPPSSIQNIRELYLVHPYPSRQLELSVFPALKVFTIEVDKDISTTLSNLISPK